MQVPITRRCYSLMRHVLLHAQPLPGPPPEGGASMNPEAASSLWSLATFAWMSPLMKKVVISACDGCCSVQHPF